MGCGCGGVEASAEDGLCTGLSDGPGTEPPDGVLTVVAWLKVTVLWGFAGTGRDVVGELCCGSKDDDSVAVDAILISKSLIHSRLLESQLPDNHEFAEQDMFEVV